MRYNQTPVFNLKSDWLLSVKSIIFGLSIFKIRYTCSSLLIQLFYLNYTKIKDRTTNNNEN